MNDVVYLRCMKSVVNQANRALDFFPSIVTAVFLTFFLGLLFDTAAAYVPSAVAFLLFFPLKVYFYSGLYGLIIEILSGEEVMFQFDRIHVNAKRFWKIYTT